MKEVGEHGLFASDAEVYRALILPPIPSSEQRHGNILNSELKLGDGTTQLCFVEDAADPKLFK